MTLTTLIGLVAASLSILSVVIFIVRWVRGRLMALQNQLARLENSMRSYDRSRLREGVHGVDSSGKFMWLKKGTEVIVLSVVDTCAVRVRLTDYPVEMLVPIIALEKSEESNV